MQDKSLVAKYKDEINKQLSNKEILTSIVHTTFSGLNEVTAKKALLEGMMRGFSFENFLKKDVQGGTIGQRQECEYENQIIKTIV